MRFLMIIGLFFCLGWNSFGHPQTNIKLQADVVSLNYLNNSNSNQSFSFIRIIHFKVLKSFPLSKEDYIGLKKLTEGKTVVSKEFGKTTFMKKIICPISLKRKVLQSKKYQKILTVLKKYD